MKEIMTAQNFHFAPKISQNEVFQPQNFVFLDRSFLTRRRFSDIFSAKKIMEGNCPFYSPATMPMRSTVIKMKQKIQTKLKSDY